MNDIYGWLPKMDEDKYLGSEFIDVYDYTLFYGLAIGILSFIFGLIAGVGGSKKRK